MSPPALGSVPGRTQAALVCSLASVPALPSPPLGLGQEVSALRPANRLEQLLVPHEGKTALPEATGGQTPNPAHLCSRAKPGFPQPLSAHVPLPAWWGWLGWGSEGQMWPRAVPVLYPLLPVLMPIAAPTLMLAHPPLIHDSHTGPLPAPSETLQHLHRHCMTPDRQHRQTDGHCTVSSPQLNPGPLEKIRGTEIISVFLRTGDTITSQPFVLIA